MKCAVITPVGPGHMDLYERECRASIEVAIQNGMGVFEDVKPFMMDDTLAQMGRSKARNITLDLAAGEGYDWVFFLDADDIMAPDAFVAFSKEYEANPSVDCFWGAIAELTASGPVAREGQIESILSTAHFLGSNPFLSIQIGFFGKLDVARRFGSDVTMDAGENFNLY